MTFDNFFGKYYSPAQHQDIVSVLKALDIYNETEIALNNYYQAADRKNKMEIITQLVFTCSEFVVILHQSLAAIIPGEEKISTEQKITDLVAYLLSDIFHLSGLDLLEFFDLIRQTARKTCLKHDWNFSMLEMLLSFDNIKAFSIEEKEKNNRNGAKPDKPVRLEWHGKKKLDFFIDDLVNIFQGVRCKRLIYLLFDKLETNFKIELSSKYLVPFLTLFYELHQSGEIKVTGNRGLFLYLNEHLLPPQNDKYPNRDFRKLRYESENTEKLKNDISLLIKPLLDKYKCNVQ